MKSILSLCSAALLTFCFTNALPAQDELLRQERPVPPFTGIMVGGAFEVILTQGTPQKVEVETDADQIDKVTTEVNGLVLEIGSKGLKNTSDLNVYITVEKLELLQISGAAEMETDGVITGEKLTLEANGAASADMVLDVTDLLTVISGAADIELSGTAVNHTCDLSGAASLKASGLETEKSNVDVSGAASARINVKEELTGNVSGAGHLEYTGNAENHLKVVSEAHVSTGDGDTVEVNIGGLNIVVNEGDDTIRVKAGNHVIIVDDEGDVKYEKCKKHKFNGHWAGFDLGFAGYVNDKFNTDFGGQYEYLDLRQEKSSQVGINFFEQNVRLARNQKFGMTTGLGLTFNDYKFSRPTYLSMDSSTLQGYLYEGISIRKSKLSIMYLSLPVLFEFQTNPWCKKNSFHIGAGMIVSARLLSHTKVYYNEFNKDYTLTQFNPETERYEAVFTGTSPDYAKVKDYNDWYLQPFKFDATVRIGWGIINLFASVSVNELFKDGKTPGMKLYPWSAGITLVNF